MNSTESRLLLSAKDLAAELSVSLASVYNLRAAGKLPLPVRVGGCVRWRRSDVELWISLDCPNRERFEQRKGASR